MISEEQFNLMLERLDSLSKSFDVLSAKIDSLNEKVESLSERVEDLDGEISDLSGCVDELYDTDRNQPTEDERETQKKAHEEAERLRKEELQKQIDTPLRIAADESGSIGGYDSRVNKEIILPEGLLVILPDSFFECLNLERFVIPATVKSIGKKLCFRCLNLKSVKFLGPCPEGLENAFEQCWRLNEILVPENELAAYQKAIPPMHIDSIIGY